jgi:hypothetical protein
MRIEAIETVSDIVANHATKSVTKRSKKIEKNGDWKIVCG